MKMTLLSAAVALSLMGSTALAADLDPPAPEPMNDRFISASFLYGFGLLDRDLSVDGFGTLDIETDYVLGAKIEGGIFLTDRVRVSADFRYSKTEIDRLSAGGASIAVDADFDQYQGFVNVAYEVALADLGLSAPFFERSKVFGIAGVGLAHIDFEGVDDEAFTGKVGLGSVFSLTDNISLVSETNYIFGQDFEFSGAGVNVDVDNEEIVSMIGLRFSF